MKKVAMSLVIFILLICLPSCATVKKDAELSQDRSNVRTIEIYNSERRYDEQDIHTFLGENEPVAVLEGDARSDFLDAFCNLKYEREMKLFFIPADGGYDYGGYIIAIRYSDGGYDIFACGGSYSYDAGDDGNGRHRYDYSDYCGETAWTDFVEKYIGQ